MKILKWLFSNEKKVNNEKDKKFVYSSKYYEQLKDMPTVFDLKYGGSAQKWAKYYKKWRNK